MKVSDVFGRLLSAAILVVAPFTSAQAMHGGGGGFGGHGFGSHSFGSHGFHRNFAFSHHGFFRDGRFFHDRDNFFFRHRFFVGFDFAAFGFPDWWYPYGDWYPYYDTYYGYPYSYDEDPSAYNGDPTRYGTQYWSNLAISVQTKLAEQGYYHGSIDGVLGPSSQRAIKEFQSANGMRVTGRIDPKLLKSLGVSYKV
jgi:hypothetical protein